MVDESIIKNDIDLNLVEVTATETNEFCPSEFLGKMSESLRTRLEFYGKDALVYGLSGDVDSMVFTYAANRVGIPIVPVYVRFLGVDDNIREQRISKIEKDLGVEVVRVEVPYPVPNIKLMSGDETDLNPNVRDQTAFNHRAVLEALDIYSRRSPRRLMRTSCINATEIMSGGFMPDELITAYSLPLSGVYKSDIYELGNYLEIDKYLMRRSPSRQVVKASSISDLLSLPTNYPEIWDSLILSENSDNVLLPPNLYQVLDPIYKEFDKGRVPDDLIMDGFSQLEVNLAVRLRSRVFRQKIDIALEVAKQRGLDAQYSDRDEFVWKH